MAIDTQIQRADRQGNGGPAAHHAPIPLPLENRLRRGACEVPRPHSPAAAQVTPACENAPREHSARI